MGVSRLRLAGKRERASEGDTSLAEGAYRRLREAIQEGIFQPGGRLRERDVAERLKISRTPVREALHRLESDGLVQMAPGGGVVIVQLDHQMISELYVIREALEGTAAALSARHMSDTDIHFLRDCLAEERPLITDPAALARINRRLHSAIYNGARNRYLLRSLNSLAEAMTLLTGTTLRVDGRAADAHKEHILLVDAIERRDAAAAEKIARDHIRAAHRARLALIG